MTIKKYLEDALVTSLTAKILSITHGETTIVRLDKTIFHPQGGGQKADRGRIGAAMVIHVAHNAGNIDHHIEGGADLEEGMVVVLDVDASWRQLNSAFHTAGHLIASVVENIHSQLHAISGHQWPGEARVEFEGNIPIDDISLSEINSKLLQDIQANLGVQIIGDPFKDRFIKIGDYSAIACGGTHLSNLGKLSSTVVKSIKSKNGRIKMSYDAI